MCRDLVHVEFIFGGYLVNLESMNTKMKDSIDLMKKKRNSKWNKSLKGIPKILYL